MPIYEYRCESCNSITEVLQKISDPAPEICEKCSKGPLRKMMSQTSFILKGTGWYVTDFKNDNKSAHRGTQAASAQESDSKESKTSESKSESTPSTTTPTASTGGSES